MMKHKDKFFSKLTYLQSIEQTLNKGLGPEHMQFYTTPFIWWGNYIVLNWFYPSFAPSLTFFPYKDSVVLVHKNLITSIKKKLHEREKKKKKLWRTICIIIIQLINFWRQSFLSSELKYLFHNVKTIHDTKK